MILVAGLATGWVVSADRQVLIDPGASQTAENLAPLTETMLVEFEKLEVPEDPASPVYFSNPGEYLETFEHWSIVFASDRAGWVDRLNERFDQPDEFPALEGETDLARRAVLEHPGYSYTPEITLASLTAECRNMICKVDVAPNHKSELVLDYGGRDPSTGLTPLDEVLFTYNFGHHVSKFNSATGVETHYLIVNGFDFQ